MWGNFFANDVNSQAYAYNNSALNIYIPRPDGADTPCTSVPEPSSLLLLGAGLMGMAGLLRRKIKK